MSLRKPIVALENPSLTEAERLVKEALAQHKALILVGNCWVDYRGRASSRLEPGERIVMIKDDGSVLVHRSGGYEPVNWQPPGCVFNTLVVDGALQVRAVRRQPREAVHVYFDRVYLASALSLVDRGEFSLYASEEDMHRAVLAEPSLFEAGFKPISYEKKVEHGFVDVYGVDKEGRFVVVEIKRKTAGREAALQLARYVEAIRSTVNREVRGVLAAPSIAKGMQRLLTSLGLEYKALDPKKCAEILRRTKTKKLAEYF
ncbi:MAG: endonuclease NucS [Candidatus Bathyarchaeia archaeon]|nr:endonuclease NucS [Candidatus Bathyarchaeota archaeon A05DMB-4]MDH7595435.1 endonuclease NucS [Candidatus Bathyarchaeota archaeon]